MSTSIAVRLPLETMAPKMSQSYPYALPELPYAHDSLTAAIDAETMKIHHGAHHKGYTDKLNAALEKHTDLHKKPLAEILSDLNSLPEEIRGAVRNNGGGYFNHALFWPMLSGTGGGTPKGELADAIKRDFGSFDAFKEKFTNTATTLFGSGWAWLVADDSDKLTLLQTHNQDTPLATGQRPVLGLDVWEHAYYLRYQNKRPEYIKNFWNVINWAQCTKNFGA